MSLRSTVMSFCPHHLLGNFLVAVITGINARYVHAGGAAEFLFYGPPRLLAVSGLFAVTPDATADKPRCDCVRSCRDGTTDQGLGTKGPTPRTTKTDHGTNPMPSPCTSASGYPTFDLLALLMKRGACGGDAGLELDVLLDVVGGVAAPPLHLCHLGTTLGGFDGDGLVFDEGDRYGSVLDEEILGITHEFGGDGDPS